MEAVAAKKNTKPWWFLFYVLALLGVGLSVIDRHWNANKYFQQAYQPKVEQANERRALRKHRVFNQAEDSSNEGGSAQPRAAGFRESDIEKQQGNRFRTY